MTKLIAVIAFVALTLASGAFGVGLFKLVHQNDPGCGFAPFVGFIGKGC